MVITANFENKLTTMNAFIILKLDRILWSDFNLGANSLNFGSRLSTIHLIFCALLFGGLTNADAQTARFFSTDNKLSSTLINQVYEDDRGLIWVATED